MIQKRIYFLLIGAMFLAAATAPATDRYSAGTKVVSQLIEELVFQSGPFKIVGDLKLPEGKGPHPVVIFVHGDGPNSRISGGTYLPIMACMMRAGYATFAWDKPGTGESTGHIDRSRLFEQRSRIVLDAIAMIKERPDIDAKRIGLWGVSQAGYIMPIVLSKSHDVAFMIAVSCPGVAGVDQGAYLVAAQAVCAGLPEEDRKQVKDLLSAVERARTYEEYVSYKKKLVAFPVLASITELGLNMRIRPKEEWHADDLKGDYYWNPIEVIEKTKIPVLAFFGEKDTQVDPVQGAQAYREALERAGNTNFRVELIQGVDHSLIISKTGCLEERRRRSRKGWQNYPMIYLDTLEEWLRNLYK
ncbi:MAG: alpha/beta fold hydrolase [Candidatus Aminicenantes bacterium]|nr:alpha/beta fold hydrolase [Candidatus Aminicenantes bacterium]MDH5707181.1 alpha/beta fold hydrolase [Candidatus Aminicenantes bacterium]